jgi:hypothetical protein
VPTDLTNRPKWKALVESNPAYKKLWLAGAFPPRISRAAPYPANRSKGVGDRMKEMTEELRLKMKEGCSCKALRNEMNRLGPKGCRRDRTRLVKALKKNAERYNWRDTLKAAVSAAGNAVSSAVHMRRIWIPNPLDPYGSLLDEAIRRTEADLQSKELA